MSDRLLVVDAGNTNLVLGIFTGDALTASWRLQTLHGQTEDELSLKITGLLERGGIDPASVPASVLASVVPPLTDTIVRAIHDVFGREPLVVRPGIRTGMRLLYDHPEEIGADRIVNAVAAWDRVGGAAVVVDFGTSTNFDCVSDRGDFAGGVIAPGLGISAEALFRSAARLPRVEVARPPRAIGKSTVAAMQSGLFFGYAGLVDGILEQVLAEMGGAPRVLATGGLAGLIAPALRHASEVVPDLTLHGLRLLHARNA